MQGYFGSRGPNPRHGRVNQFSPTPRPVHLLHPLLNLTSPTSASSSELSYCLPCYDTRPLLPSSGGIGEGIAGGHPTPQNLRDNPERLAKVKTELCHYFEEGGLRTCPYGDNCVFLIYSLGGIGSSVRILSHNTASLPPT